MISDEAPQCSQLLVTRGILKRIYSKVSEGWIPIQKKDFPKGLNKMDRNLVVSASSDGSGEGELSLSVVENSSLSVVEDPPVQPNPYDPQVLIQSVTTDWVMRCGAADRIRWRLWRDKFALLWWRWMS